MIMAELVTPEQELLLTANTSYSIRFAMEELPVTGVKTGGVKGIQLKDGEYLAAVNILKPGAEQDLVIVTQRGAVKRMNVSEIELGNRAKRGVVTLKELKANPHRVFAIVVVKVSDTIVLETEKGVQEEIKIVNLSRADRYSNGSLRVDTVGDGALVRVAVLKQQ